MGCLSAIVKRRKAKEEKSKLLKEQLCIEESTENLKELQIRRETNAATRIQAVFRSFLTRQALQSLKGTSKTPNLEQDQVHDHALATSSTILFFDQSVKSQAISALNHLHSWSKIRDQIRARRLYMVQEARIKRKKLESQLKLESKLHELEVEWCGGSETMEEILNRIQQREEASIKRERAMAYAFVHQWRANSSQFMGHTCFSLGKESRGWSWVERWVAARPWEIRVVSLPINLKKAQTKSMNKSDKLLNQGESKVLIAQNTTVSNESCKNRKTCSNRPISI